jgi:hypothetical protein
MNARNMMVTACVLACAGIASADIINISGDVAGSNEMTGSNFMGTLDYTFDGGDMGTLIVTLTNTTPAPVGGFLTGFLCNVLSEDDAATAALTSASDADFLNTGNQSGSPFGRFDAGAALGGDWLGGGNPNFGMAIGATEMFTFKVTASDAAALTAVSFIGDGDDVNFVARFRGLTDGGSDKVPGVPAPGASVLALAGLAFASRRRR